MIFAPGPTDPEHVGPYKLTGLLGSGGQGAVYLGQDRTGRQVAVKVLHARLARDPETRRQFTREVSAARKVGAFGTAQVLDVDIEGDQPYIVSEYVPGESLQQLISRDGPRDAGGLRRLMLATAAALQAIHRAGVVHRDFKPSNVLLGPDGPRVIDFGIARALEATTTMSSGVAGTPPYMSPEQISGRDVGPASDVFSWAVSMVYAATGRPAFGADSIPAVFNRVLTHPPDLSGVPAELRDLLAACLNKAPEQRPTVDEVLGLLLGHTPAKRPLRGQKPVALAFTMQVLAVLATLLLAAVSHYGFRDDPDGGERPAPFPWVDGDDPFWLIMLAWLIAGGSAAWYLRRRR